MTPRVLMLVADDWANTGWSMVQAYRAAGIQIHAFKLRPHVFGYDPELPPIGSIQKSGLDDIFREADVLHFMHSAVVSLPEWDLRTKRVIVQHGGTVYRQSAPEINRMLDPIVTLSLIETPDLLGLGAKNEVLFPPPVDTESLIQRLHNACGHGPRVIGHFPSNSAVKATERLVRVLEALSANPRYSDRLHAHVSDERVSHAAQIERLRGCDIYVDVLASHQNGKRYGEYGVTGREAAALGCVVVSQHFHQDAYEREFGQTEIVRVTSEESLEFCLRELLDMEPEAFEWKRQQTRRWIVRNHSIEAAGARLGPLVRRLFSKEVA